MTSRRRAPGARSHGVFGAAPCRLVSDPNAFFPESERAAAAAVEVCGHCPLLTRTRCLSVAVDHDDHDGVWGGMSPRMRETFLTSLGDGARDEGRARWIDAPVALRMEILDSTRERAVQAS